MEEIILFGAVEKLKDRLAILEKLCTYNVLEIWDNFSSKKVCSYKGNILKIVAPHRIQKDVPVLIIPWRYEKEIRKQLVEECGIKEEMIKGWWYCFHNIKEEIMKRYRDVSDFQMQAILKYLKNHDLHVFNGGVHERYQNNVNDVPIYDDDGWLYSYWDGKKIYMKRNMSRKEVQNYINSLNMEQDKDSPHCYEQRNIIGRSNDIIIDAGAAEGFFSLERIDTAKHIYLIENDAEWIEALERTFLPYINKVTIIPKYLSDYDDDAHITLEAIDRMGAPITTIKLDIEGEEKRALQGGEIILKENRKMHVVACVYHNSEDAELLSKFLLKQNFKVSFTKGYMFFPYGKDIVSELRRGIVRGEKDIV